MSARIHGFTMQTLAPGPDLLVSRDAEGKVTAQREFTCLKAAANTAYIQNRIQKGTPIGQLCSDVPYTSLEVETSQIRDEPGGFSKIVLTFTGFEEEGEFAFDREVTYSLRGVTQMKPIWQHPDFIAAFEDEQLMKLALVKICLAEAYAEGETGESNNWRVYKIPTDEEIFSAWVSNEERDKWWQSIVVDGDREYHAPSYEWTRTTANAGGLSAVDLAPLGKSDNPPGDPPEPSGIEGWWRLSDLSDDRSEGVSSNSLVWRFEEGTPKHYEE